MLINQGHLISAHMCTYCGFYGAGRLLQEHRKVETWFWPTNKQTNNNTTRGISGTHIHLCWLRGHFRDQQHPGETHRRQPPRQVWSMPGRVQVISSFVKLYLNLSISWPDADHCCYFTRRSMAPLTSRVTKQVLTSWSKFPVNLAWVDYSLFCKPSNFHFHFFIHKISFVRGWGWGLSNMFNCSTVHLICAIFPNIIIVIAQVLYNGYFHCAEPILDKFIAALEKEREGNEAKMENDEETI